MKRFRSRKTLTIAVVALAVVGGGGAAIAADQGSSSTGQSFLDSVARHLGISSQKLEDATKAAAIEQVDAALKEGKITQAQADELKARIQSGEFPPFAGPLFGPRFGHFRRRLSRADPSGAAYEAQRRPDPRGYRQGPRQVGGRAEAGDPGRGRKEARPAGRGRRADAGRSGRDARSDEVAHRRARRQRDVPVPRAARGPTPRAPLLVAAPKRWISGRWRETCNTAGRRRRRPSRSRRYRASSSSSYWRS